MRRDGSAATVDTDALTGLLADASGYLGPLLPGVLDRASALLPALAAGSGDRPGTGPWTWRLDLGRGSAQHPVLLVVQASPWRVTVATDPAGDGLHTAGDGRLVASLGLALDSHAASCRASLDLAGIKLARDPGTGRVTFGCPWLEHPVQLLPADPAGTGEALAPLVPRLLLDAAASLAFGSRAGDLLVGSLSGLLADPAGWLLRPAALGSTGGTSVDPATVNRLLGALASASGLATSEPGSHSAPVELPGGIVIAAAAGSDPPGSSTLTLQLAQPLALDPGGTGLSLAKLEAGLELDATRHVSVTGQVGLHLPLPGSWTALDLTVSGGTSGVALTLTLGQPAATITLLPRVSGLQHLVTGAAGSLLTSALDALADAIPAESAGRQVALQAATDLGLYTASGGFDAAALGRIGAALGSGPGAGVPMPQQFASAASHALTTLLGTPGSVTVTAHDTTGVELDFRLDALGDTAQATVTVDFQAPSAALALHHVTAGPLTAEVAAGVAWPHGADSAPAVTANATLGLTVDTGLGVALAPRLLAVFDGTTLTVRLLPFAGDNATAVELAPHPGTNDPDAMLRELATQWVAPLAAATLVAAGKQQRGQSDPPWLDRPLWPGAATTARNILKAAGLLSEQGTVRQLPATVPGLLRALLGGLDGIDIPLGSGLTLGLAAPAGGGKGEYGLRLAGSAPLPAGRYALTLGLGLPPSPAAPAGLLNELGWGSPGLTVVIVQETADHQVSFSPALHLAGVGARLSAADAGSKLIDTSAFSLGAAGGYLHATIALPAGKPSVTAIRGAVLLDGIGVPFLTPPAAGDADPVISSLLAPAAGDQAATNPPLDLAVGTGLGPGDTSPLVVAVNGLADSPDPVWLPVHRSLGPVYVDQVGVNHPAGDPHLQLHLDAAVEVAGLAVALRNLAVGVPLTDPARPARWSVGLDGLAVRFDAPQVHVEGSLSHNGNEYDGGLTAQVAGRGLSAIGAFSRPSDGSGTYLSLFAFLEVMTPLGGPPYFYVLGLAGGAGFNRQLIVPTDPMAAPTFPLVARLAAPTSDGATVQQALAPLGQAMPARRGSYWVAAGVHFTTFEVLDTTAIVYVALDRGVDVGVLGVSRLILPQQDLAAGAGPLVNAELAVNARYDSVAALLSIRAQLTDHSWIISKDCQLTGGFAFMVWFAERRFVLTIGGYAPGFTPAADLPVVPRVGFHWAVSDTITVKGEAYFALLPSCVMAGGRLEVSYSSGDIHVWFTAWLDVLVAWDPLTYHADLGVSIGAKFSKRVCVIWCVQVDVEVSLGASVTFDGPPLHGRARVDLAVCSVTVEFGEGSGGQGTHLGWADFAGRYLPAPAGTAAAAGSAAEVAGVHVVTGAAPAAGSGSAVPPAGPAQVLPTFSLCTESRIPVFGAAACGLAVTAPQGQVDFDVPVDAPRTPPSAQPDHIAAIPMCNDGGHVTRVAHTVTITRMGNALASAAGISAATRPAGFSTAVWQGPPSGGAAGANPRGDSLTAIGGLDITFAPAIGDPVKKLSYGGDAGEDLDCRTSPALPFTSPTRARAAMPAAALAGIPGRAIPRAAARTPSRPPVRPAAVLQHTAGATTVVLPPSGTSAYASDLVPGTSVAWDLPGGTTELAIQLTGDTPARITCVGAGGVLLSDAVLPPGAAMHPLPPGTARLVATAAGLIDTGATGTGPMGAGGMNTGVQDSAAPAGWHATTPLLQVAASTLLGPSCVVLPGGPLPGVPWRPRHLGSGPAYLLARHPRTRTVLPAGVTQVLVAAEPAGAATGPDPLISLPGSLIDVAGPASRVPLPGAGPGTTGWLYPRAASAAAGAPTIVTVDTGTGWRLSGVVGFRQNPDTGAALPGFPAAMLVTTAAPPPGGRARLTLISRPARADDAKEPT